MLSGVNSPRPIPGPGGKALEQAMSLLVSFGGGDKELKSLLKEMKDVQAHNEKVIEEAKRLKSEADKKMKELAQREAEFKRDMKDKESVIADREAMLSNASREIDVEKKQLEKRRSDLEAKFEQERLEMDKEQQANRDYKQQLVEKQSKCDALQRDAINKMRDAEKRLSAMMEIKNFINERLK